MKRLAISLASAAAAFAALPASAQAPELASALQFNHFMVAISVDDLDAETRWFVDNLGFQVDTDASLGATQFRWLTNGNERIELIKTESGAGPDRPAPPRHATVRGITQVTLETNDIEAVRSALAMKGIEPALDITEVAPLGIKVLYLLDPEGNAVEIAQRL